MNDPMTVVEKCQTCSTVYDIVVEAQDYYDWARGAKYLQDAFPYLTADERELLLSHTCGRASMQCSPKRTKRSYEPTYAVQESHSARGPAGTTPRDLEPVPGRLGGPLGQSVDQPGPQEDGA